ncbi:MAG: c-type cytochrome domain-containing protein, partial [Rubripirellula sp.]
MTTRFENYRRNPVSVLRQRRATVIHVFLLVVAHSCAATLGQSQDTKINFNRDIRPLLSDRCFHCHGPDEEDRKAGLRLDRRDGDEGALNALSPNDVAGSELYKRITSSDPDLVMPPPDAHKKPISPQEQKLFRAWIEEGGNYETFWAFTSLEPSSPPTVPANSWGTGPIDWFVKRKLDERGTSPQPAADKRTLLRRL